MPLTRNESADLFQKIWSTIVEEAPESTAAIRRLGLVAYVTGHKRFSLSLLSELHTDHLDYLTHVLTIDPLGCQLVDKFAQDIRAIAGATASPWRDVEEEPVEEPIEYALAV